MQYNMRTIVAMLLAVMLFVAAVYFSISYAADPVDTQFKHKKELLVYCGITMVKPISDIARIIEEHEDCKIIITKGGSGNLLRAIEINGIGDLYLPGSDSYIKSCVEKGLVEESTMVGHNRAALLVQKGNPKNISADLANLAAPHYYVMICDSESGSIGRETKKILQKQGIYREVCQNARRLTSDSKDLVKALQDKEADLVVNWHATACWPENEPYVDTLPIGAETAPPKKLVLGLLTTSRYPEIARKFLAYASSPQGKNLFQKYGLYDPQ